jgi:hypothetical protein
MFSLGCPAGSVEIQFAAFCVCRTEKDICKFNKNQAGKEIEERSISK